jgi:hypothetical protein
MDKFKIATSLLHVHLAIEMKSKKNTFAWCPLPPLKKTQIATENVRILKIGKQHNNHSQHR